MSRIPEKRKSSLVSFSIGLSSIALLGTGIISWWAYSLYSTHETILTLSQSAAQNEMARELKGKLTMVISEGLTLWVLLIACLGWLFYLYKKDLRRSEELKTLFAVWTHEFKTPVASIQLQAETLLLEKDISATSQKFLKRMIQDCGRLHGFIERILHMARTHTEPMIKLTPGPIDEDIERWWKERGQFAHHPRPQFQLAKESDVWAFREPETLAHILNNLVDNAIKHGASNSIDVSIMRQNEWAIVRVTSPHSMFPQEEMDRVGSLFMRGSNAKKNGAGVGLFLVNRLMRAMGGTMKLSNDVVGAVVELYFKSYRPAGSHYA